MNTSILDDSPIFLQILEDLLLFIGSTVQIFAPCRYSVVLGNRLHRNSRILIDSLLSESKVDVVAESRVAEMAIFVIFVSEGLEFGLGKSEVEHGEHCAELRHSDLALAELVKISEELFYSDSLHDNLCLKALLDV